MNYNAKNEHFGGQSGFSLMEMMVVIVIIAVLSAIALPTLINPENKANKAARELMGDMQQTRAAAIKNNQNWSIVFDTVNNLYQIRSNPGNVLEETINFSEYGSGIQYGGGTAAFPVGAAFSGGVSYAADILTFNPQGTCNAGYVYFFYGDVSYAIGTLTTGVVRFLRWDGGAWQ